MHRSTNPFDDSSKEEGSDSEGFEDCATDLLTKSLSGSADDAPISLPLFTNDVSLLRTADHSSALKKKRTAPLSFNEPVIVANPALKFDEGSISTSEGQFFSPLESALLSQKDGRDDNDSDDIDNDEVIGNDLKEGENLENEGGESYLSSWFSYLLSSPKMLTGQYTTGDNAGTSNLATDEFSHATLESNHSFLSSRSRPTSRLDGLIINSEDEADKGLLDYQSSVTSPLSEAKNVIERMDSISRTIHSAMKATSNKTKMKPPLQKRTKAEEEADRRILRTIEDNPKDSGLTMNHKHAGTPWTRLIILEELGTSSSWIILLIPYIAFLLALALDSDTLLWNVISGPIEAKILCDRTNNIQSEYSLEDKKALENAYQFSTNEASNMDFEADVVMSTGPITDVPVMSAFLYGDLLMGNLSNTSVSLISDEMVFYVNVLLQQPIESSPTDDKNWSPVSISRPEKLDIVCNNKLEKFNETYWECSSPRNVDFLFSMPDTSILTGGAIRVDTMLSFVPPQNQSDPVNVKSLQNLMTHEFGFLHGEVVDMNTTITNPDATLSEIAHSTSYMIKHSSSLKPKVVILVRILTLIINCGFIVFWFWSMGINGFFSYSDACCTCFRNWGGDEGESLVKKAEGE